MIRKYVIRFFVVITWTQICDDTYGHVALTFPHARKYDLDFLDNARTPGPCGMPRGGIKTSLMSGSKFNVTWHLAYPHQGGFRLQILDALDRPLVDLTPVTEQSEFVSDDPTAQYYPVELPQNFTCMDCTVRLLREAAEWGSSYRFWSCADVDIVNRKSYKENCSGHGRYLAGRCRCDTLYHGSRCEMHEECMTSTDCGPQGTCVDNGGTTSPTKQCYCNVGWFGSGCSKKSPFQTTAVDFDGYTMKRFSDDFTFYWRILEDTSELEGVMVVNGTSWVGIGWRSSSLSRDCRAFPEINGKKETLEMLPQPEPKSEPTMNIDMINHLDSEPETAKYYNTSKQLNNQKQLNAEPEPEGIKSQPKPSAEPSLKSAARRRSTKSHSDVNAPLKIDTDTTIQTSVTYQVSSKQGHKKRSLESVSPESIGEPTSEPESKSEPEAILNAGSEPALHSDPKLKSEPEPISLSELESISHFEPEPTSHTKPYLPTHSEPNSEPEPNPSAHSEPNSEPEPKTEPEPHSELEPKSEPEPEGKSEFGKSGTTEAGSTLHRYTPKHDFHAMDCTDLIIGSARGNSHRIGDYYTRDRSTPRHDTFWGGKESLTGVMGYEQNGVTTIMFRRKLKSNDITDHEIIDGKMHVIWARGQEHGKYQHRPSSGIEKATINNKEFYQPDELKYHGHNSQRGIETINFFDEKNKEKFGGNGVIEGKRCGGEWRFPRRCSVENATCDYYIEWTYRTQKDEVTFTIVTKESNTWTGVGFSNDKRMTQTDAVIGWIDRVSGKPFLMDTWITGYVQPVLDSSQDTINHSGKNENGMTTIKFTRKRITDDIKDLSFTDKQCLYMMFPVKGGEYNQVNKKIRKHASIHVSSKKICISSCGIDDEEEEEKKKLAELTSQLHYDIEVKLLNLPDGFKAPQPGSQDFDEISKRVSYSFGPLLTNLPGYSMIKLNKLQRLDGDDGIIAKINLIVDKNEAKERALKPNDTVANAETVLRQALFKKKVGSLTVDPQYLIVRAPLVSGLSNDFENEIEASKNILLGETKLYIIAGCVASLIALALLQASCTVYKTTRKRMTKQECLIANNAWRNYTTGANTNFAFEAFETEEKAPPLPVPSLSQSKDVTDGVITRSGITSTMETHHHQHPMNSQQRTRAAYSLPRAPGPKQTLPVTETGYYTQDRRNQRPKSHHGNSNMSSQQSSQQPDFYFMPSQRQRKYSGEVVRVYVDYGNQKSK